MSIDQFEDRWAIVSGAASGIGAAFSEKLAALGMHLVLADCRQHDLECVTTRLQQKFTSRIIPLTCDLGDHEQTEWLLGEISRRAIHVELLVNNAGFGVVCGPENIDVTRVTSMLRVNVEALTHLTYELLPAMLARRHGAVINVASMAAFQPVAYMASYAASKAYILHFSEALWSETRHRGVSVTAVCPGFTDTSFFTHAGVPELAKGRRLQAPRVVVDAALAAMSRRSQFVVPGWLNYLLSLGPRLATRRKVVLETTKYFQPVKVLAPVTPDD